MSQEGTSGAYPADFVQLLFDSLGEERGGALIKHLSDEVPVSVRCNPQKTTVEELREHFGDNAGDAVEWCQDAFYLKERPSFTFDPLFHAGAYYVQEASSMYVGALLDKALTGMSAVRVLDLCAAPGGKTTHILSKLSADSLLVTNEVIRSRATILAENVAKWGVANVVVSNNDPSDFKSFADYFDIVVVDAPCSGEGMFRKDQNAVSEWSLDNVALCAARQRRIVSDIWPTLKGGGYMIYSTCTFNSHENRENVAWMCSELGGEVVEQRQFLPGEVPGEGFFCALIRKNFVVPNSNNSNSNLGRIVSRGSKGVSPAGGVVKQFLQDCEKMVSDGNVLHPKGDLVKAYPKALYSEMLAIESSLRVIHSGVAVATIKGKDFIPEADLALSKILSPNFFVKAELTLQEAIKFLSKETIVLPSAPRGYILLTYHNHPLGFVKNLGNRTNNLHPIARRIRSKLS